MVFGGSRAGRYRRKVATPSSPEHAGAPLIFAEAQFQGRPTFYARWLASIFLDLIETILVYKFPQLTREEIRAVLHLPVTDVIKTRSYQDAFVKGREEGREETRRELILSQLARRCGVLTPSHLEKIQGRRLPVRRARRGAVGFWLDPRILTPGCGITD
jgi:hypothetical protein